MKPRFGRPSEEDRIKLEMKQIAIDYQAISNKQKELIKKFKTQGNLEVSQEEILQL